MPLLSKFGLFKRDDFLDDLIPDLVSNTRENLELTKYLEKLQLKVLPIHNKFAESMVDKVEVIGSPMIVLLMKEAVLDYFVNVGKSGFNRRYVRNKGDTPFQSLDWITGDKHLFSSYFINGVEYVSPVWFKCGTMR